MGAKLEGNEGGSADELLLKVLAVYDDLYACRLALHEQLSDGHFSVSRARYDMSDSSRLSITAVDYNMAMKASKKLMDEDDSVAVVDVKPGSTGDEDLDAAFREQAEEDKTKELYPKYKTSVLKRKKEEQMDRGYTASQAEDHVDEEEVEKEVKRAIAEKLRLDRFNEKTKHDPLYWFGHVQPPKDLKVAQRYFVRSLENVAKAATLTRELLRLTALYDAAVAAEEQ